MNKKLLIAILVVVALSLGYAWLILKNSPSPASSPTRQIGNYFIQIISTDNPMCGTEEVRDATGVHVVTLHLCEDNIFSIVSDGDWIVITTDSGRFYKKNSVTGEEVLSAKQTHGFGGGMSKVN